MVLANKKPYHTYNSELTTRARDLRKNSTLSEVLLWEKLKRRQLLGYKFMRQKEFGPYIVDLYCHQLQLVIEIDGLSHDFKMEYDKKRQNYLESCGLSIVRFNDLDVKKDINNVIQRIVDWINHYEQSK